MPKLHDATFAGNIEKIKCFIDIGEDINAKNENGLKALDIAIMKNDIQIVKFLLSDKLKNKIVIDMNVWLRAIRVQDNTITSCLLNNFDPKILEVEDSEGLKLIHYTVIYRYVDMLCFLIRQKVDINSVALDGCTPLHFAVVQNDTNIMKILLDNGAEVCTKTLDGSNVIHLAVKHQSLNCLNMLLKYKKIGINDQVTSTGLTALGIAIEKCDKNIIVEKLMRSGATLDCKDNNDRTLLHIAVEQSKIDMVKFLLQKGMDVNATTKEKCTPLEIALTSRNDKIVRIILNYNPDVTIKNKDGLCPLFTAIKYKCCSIELFSLQSDLNVMTNDNSSILHYALQFNDNYIINNLLEEDIKFTQNIFGEHPLHIACQYCNEIIVSKILNKNVDVNVRTIDGSTPLHYATKYFRTYNVPPLLNYGADINAENNKKETPLYFVVRRALPMFVEMLLKNGADPSHVADDETTPLHWAIGYDNESVASILIKYGANINKVNGNNDNCLHLALKYGCHLFLYRYLDSKDKCLIHGMNVNGLNKDDETPLELSLRNGHWYIIRYIKSLVEAGAVLKRNKHNETPTHIAIKNLSIKSDLTTIKCPITITGDSTIIKYLFNLESETKAQTNDGQTFLHYVVKYYNENKSSCESLNESEKTFDFLLAKTKDMIDSRDNKGQTPLHIAVKRGFINIVKKLLNNKANINAKDNKKYTPLHYAIEAENMDLTIFLLKKSASLNHDVSIFDLAAKIKNQHIYRILLKYRIDH